MNHEICEMSHESSRIPNNMSITFLRVDLQNDMKIIPLLEW